MKYGMRLTALALLAAITLTGCSWKQMLATVGIAGAAAGGAAGYYYLEGDLESDHDHDIDVVYKACQKGLDDEGWKIGSKEVNELNGKIEATQGDEKATLKLKKQENGDTHLSIRIGTFGDEAKAKDLLDAIDKHL